MTDVDAIWTIPHSTTARKYAVDLVALAQRGVLGNRRGAVRRLIEDQPALAEEVLLALAELAVLPIGPTDPPDDAALAKRAHSAHVRGFRGAGYEWVARGERDYQRDKKRRQRAEKRAANGPEQEVA